MALYAKVNAQGEILEIGSTMKLGSGTGESLRSSAAWEISQGYKIRRLMVVDELMELAAETVYQVMYSEEGQKHATLHSPYSSQPGRAAHRDGPWREMAADEHLRHARLHLTRDKQNAKVMPEELHLEHALCRVVMALWTRRRRPSQA